MLIRKKNEASYSVFREKFDFFFPEPAPLFLLSSHPRALYTCIFPLGEEVIASFLAEVSELGDV